MDDISWTCLWMIGLKMTATVSFKASLSMVKNLVCVNDIAERGIALIQELNQSTIDEDQKQYLLQVVEITANNLKIVTELNWK